jgi:D-alanyl-D-alanine dipeptidase
VSDDRFLGRRRRARSLTEAAGLDGLLVTPGASLVYLTGHTPPPLERLTVLVLGVDREAVLLVPELERLGALDAVGGSHLEIVGWTDAEDPYQRLGALTARGRWAISDDAWAAHVLGLQREVASIELEPLGSALPLLRAVKDDEEIRLLRGAARGADDVFVEIVRLDFAGRTERDVAADLDRLLREHGHERVGFTIVGSGPNGASPHHDPGDRVIARGDAVVLDFGGVAGGYCSDITRTVFVGEPSSEAKEIYEVVRAAQQAAFEAVRPGVACEDVDRAARDVIDAAGHGERFFHRTGHGIGLEVHEPPSIVEGNRTPLEEGMTFSDEPGIYFEGRFGVRIEDQLAVTASGADRLNRAPRELTLVG